MPQRTADPGPARQDGSAFERRVTVHQLRVFKTVADLHGFSRAAAHLHLSQPAVSHQMRALAEAVGAPLFDRPGRTVRPSEAGRVLYEHARRILSDFDATARALDDMHGLRHGALRVVGDTTVGIYVLPDVLGTFKQAHPAIDVRLDVGNRQHVYERLLADEADFAVLGRPWPRPDIPLAVRPFLPNELIAIAAATHPLATMRRLTLARLADEPFIFREQGSGTRETTEEALRRTGRPVRVTMELASNGAIKRAVARGLGVAILSRYAVATELRLGTLVELRATGLPLRRRWHLVYPRDRQHGPLGAAFLAFLDQGGWRDALAESLTIG